MIDAIPQTTNIDKQINKPNTGNPTINPSRMMKKRAAAIILLNLKESFLGVKSPILNLTPLDVMIRISCGPMHVILLLMIASSSRRRSHPY
jgi:hypothetical protein